LELPRALARGLMNTQKTVLATLITKNGAKARNFVLIWLRLTKK